MFITTALEYGVTRSSRVMTAAAGVMTAVAG
jgi:hypothetical protein